MPKIRPLTPLFPDNDTAITIEQGEAGTCYLLATLDAVYNGHPLGKQYLQNLFSYDKDGNVVVKLKHSENFACKRYQVAGNIFQYNFDFNEKKHTFKITPKVQKLIDQHQKNSKTNSLAVKILEAIMPCFFFNKETDGEIKHDDINSLLDDHYTRKRHDELKNGDLVAKILGALVQL